MINRRQFVRNALAGVFAATTMGCERAARGRIPGTLVGTAPSTGHRLLAEPFPAPSHTRTARVVIAGAGIAGLAAAYGLRSHGVKDVLMIEVAGELGGNASCGSNVVSAFPWGAHYVPLVRADCRPVLDLFRDLKIIVDIDADGRPVYDEYCLSADPQERLWMYGRWQDGLVPELGSDSNDRAQFATFFSEMEQLKHRTGSDGRPVFAIPVDASSTDPQWRALDAMTMAAYLDSRGWTSPLLRWYVNYCCRDDYGSSVSTVSAWAGLHYFAARNGTAANADPWTVVTWPEGNGRLVQELAIRGGADRQCSAIVTHVGRSATGVTLDYFDLAMERSVRVEAAAAVVCLPRFIASRVVDGLAAEASAGFSYAPWMVANVTLSRLPAGRGQPLAWDNVIFDSPLLGYVDATHQRLEQFRRETVITYYWPLSDESPQRAREWALGRSLEEWQGYVIRDLLRVHPELANHVENIDVRVWGHGMIRPTPGFLWGPERSMAARHLPPIFFAHSDLSGISIFEEAYCRGLEAGTLAARTVGALTRRVPA